MPKEAFVAVWLKTYYERALLWVLANTRKVIDASVDADVCVGRYELKNT